MKKINRFAFVLAGVVAAGALMACQQQTAESIYQVGNVSDFKAKAYPGANYLTWSPSEITSGYALFRQIDGGEKTFVTNLGADATSCFDFISTSNEWADGSDVKYFIQNKGNALSRNVGANVGIAGSGFVEASVKAINPGYGADVVYKVPALAEGKSVPDFAAFDYVDKSAELVEPKSTVALADGEVTVTFQTVPYATTKIYVANEDATEKMAFDVGRTSEGYPSALGTVKLSPVFVGKNVFWAEVSFRTGYYKTKKIQLGDVTFTPETSVDMDYNSFAGSYDRTSKKVKFTWNAATNTDGSVNKAAKFYIYGQIDYYNWKKIPLTYTLDELKETYTAYVDWNDEEFQWQQSYRLYASYDGKPVTHWSSGSTVAYGSCTVGAPASSVYSFYGNIGTTYSADAKSVSLYWSPVTTYNNANYSEPVVDSKVVVYRISKKTYTYDIKAGKGENSEETEITSELKFEYNKDKNLVETKEFAKPTFAEGYSGNTTYTVYAWYDGVKLGSSSVIVN